MNKLYIPISFLQRLRDVVRRKLGILLFDRKKTVHTISEIKHIVFLRWDAKLGDSFVSSSSINAIKAHNPDCCISVVTTPAMSTLFKQHFGANKIYSIPKRPNYRQLQRLAEDLGEIDLIIALNDNMKMKDMFFLSRAHAKHIAGLDDDLDLINIKLGQKTQELHFSEKFKAALEAVNISVPEIKYTIPLLEDSSHKACSFLQDRQITSPFLTLNPFGSGHARKLNKQSVTKLLDQIRTISPDLPVILLSAPDTCKQAEDMCQSLDDHVFHFNVSESIFDVIALIDLSQYVISVDTAIVHIASGLNKKQLCIYNPNPKNYAQWGPNSDKAITVFAGKTTPPTVNQLDWQDVAEKTRRLLR